jgi:hypothetical protein
MTIAKGQPWGIPAAPPAGLRIAADDAELARFVAADAHGAYAVRAGDLHRSIGAPGGRDDVHRLPIDALLVASDLGERLAVSHVVARNGWWSGPIIVVTNTGYVGAWNVAPRAHPNDGRMDVLEVNRSMGVRQRLQARSRLRSGTHVPHPDVQVRTAETVEWAFDGALGVYVDGVHLGRSSRLAVTISPDHFAIYA